MNLLIFNTLMIVEKMLRLAKKTIAVLIKLTLAYYLYITKLHF